MSRRWLIILVVFFLIVFCFAYLYFLFGFRYYIKAILYRYSVDTENVAEVDDKMFLYDPISNHVGGIYAGSIVFPVKGIFMWGMQGLKFYREGQFPVYTIHNACVDSVFKVISSPDDGSKILQVEKTLFQDLNKWAKSVKPGYFIDLDLVFENGRSTGSYKELWSTDWWPFIKGDLKEQCVY